MLEKMDSLVARGNATVVTSPRPASSEPRPLAKEDIGRILADAARTQENWGSLYDFDRSHQEPAPVLDELVEREILPGLDIRSADVDRLLSAARREQAHRDEQTRQRRCREFCETVGQRFARATLENYEATSPEQRKVIEALHGYATDIRERVTEGAGIVLFGSAGSGKTHLAAAVAKTAIEANLTVAWMNGQDLFGRFRDAIEQHDSEGRIVRELVGPDILTVDDALPPGGKLTEYQASNLYRIIDVRYRNCKPTWATMNVAGGSEAEQGMGAQAVDRLRHGALTLFCNWASCRKTGT